MLPDPLALAANAPTPALNFAVIRSDGYGAERRDSGGLYGLTINHSTSKNGDRHYLKISKTVDATNPYNDLVTPQSASISVSISRPPYGFDATAMEALYTAMTDAISEATFASVLNFES
jgi:hypothetical protein